MKTWDECVKKDLVELGWDRVDGGILYAENRAIMDNE